MGCCNSNKIDGELVVNLNIFKLYKCKDGNYFTIIDGDNINIILSNNLVDGYDKCFTLIFTNLNIMTIEFKNNNSVKIIYNTNHSDKSNDVHLKYNIILNHETEWITYFNQMNEFNLWRDKLYQEKYGKIYNIILNNKKIF